MNVIIKVYSTIDSTPHRTLGDNLNLLGVPKKNTLRLFYLLLATRYKLHKVSH